MKKIVVLCSLAAVVMALSSCGKERTCRCSVLGDQTVRIIKIEKGTCEDLRSLLYDQDPVLYPDITDSVLCTDFDFEAYTNN